MYYLLCKYTNNEVFDNFPKIFQKLLESRANVSEHFTNMSEDNRRLPKTSNEDPKMFRSYTNEFKYS